MKFHASLRHSVGLRITITVIERNFTHTTWVPELVLNEIDRGPADETGRLEEYREMIGYEEVQDHNRGRSDNYPIHTEKIFADRKIFFLDLKENDRGRFVKITEDVRGRRDTIMLPTEILEDFIGALQNISEANEDEGAE